MQIKINNEIFNCSDGGVQLSFGSHASIHLNFDLNSYPTYEKFFVKLHESSNKFSIISSKFVAEGTRIKTLDIDFRNKKMNVSFHCQVLNTTEPSMRREEAINEIFSKTFDNN
jgi:hypothetical protein